VRRFYGFYFVSERSARILRVSFSTSDKVVAKLGVSCYGLQPADTPQLELFETAGEKVRKVSDAVDMLNNRYGEYVVMPAIMMGMENLILDRIAFGSVKELEDLYSTWSKGKLPDV
jgi:hypothetical protein